MERHVRDLLGMPIVGGSSNIAEEQHRERRLGCAARTRVSGAQIDTVSAARR